MAKRKPNCEKEEEGKRMKKEVKEEEVGPVEVESVGVDTGDLSSTQENGNNNSGAPLLVVQVKEKVDRGTTMDKLYLEERPELFVPGSFTVKPYAKMTFNAPFRGKSDTLYLKNNSSHEMGYVVRTPNKNLKIEGGSEVRVLGCWTAVEVKITSDFSGKPSEDDWIFVEYWNQPKGGMTKELMWTPGATYKHPIQVTYNE